MAYVKLHEELLTSSLWSEPDATRLVWITLLLMMDAHGEVQASVPGLAHHARVAIPDCQAALQTLTSADLYSRTPDHDGRRLEAVRGGWRVLNADHYRHKLSAEDRRQKEADRKARYRARVSQERGTHGTHAGLVPGPSPQAEAEAEEELQEQADTHASLVRARFEEFWSLYPRHVAEPVAWSLYRALAPSAELHDAMLFALGQHKKSDQWRRGVVPNASTWLRERRWTDTLAEPAPKVGARRSGWTCPHNPPCGSASLCEVQTIIRSGRSLS